MFFYDQKLGKNRHKDIAIRLNEVSDFRIIQDNNS